MSAYLDRWRQDHTKRLIATFGTVGTYTRPETRETWSLTGIWKAPYTNPRLDGLGIPGIEDAAPALIYRTPDLPQRPIHNDQWSDGQTIWFIIEVRENPRQGMTVLILSRDPG